MRRRLAVICLALAAIVAACGGNDDGATVSATVDDEADARPPAWERLPDAPLGPRTNTVLAWTGAEIIVVGGDQFACPPAASCTAPTEPPLMDGAAYDVDQRTWRPIDDAPVGFHAAASAVHLDGAVYVLAHTDYAGATSLLRYDVDGDDWTELPKPPGDLAWRRLLVAGDRLVAYTTSEEAGTTGDHWFDPTTNGWMPVPDDPMSAAFDRTLVWADPHLYLFDKELVPNPGSEKPAIVRAARLDDVEDGTWKRLPDSEIVGGWGPWIVDGQRLTNPAIGSSDGGEVNGWDKAYAWGGVLDGDTETWHPLPDGTPTADDLSIVPVAGGFSATSAAYAQPVGLVLDVEHDRWLSMAHPTRDDETEAVQHQTLVIAAGRDAIAFADGDLWWWRAP